MKGFLIYIGYLPLQKIRHIMMYSSSIWTMLDQKDFFSISGLSERCLCSVLFWVQLHFVWYYLWKRLLTTSFGFVEEKIVCMDRTIHNLATSLYHTFLKKLCKNNYRKLLGSKLTARFFQLGPSFFQELTEINTDSQIPGINLCSSQRGRSVPRAVRCHRRP